MLFYFLQGATLGLSAAATPGPFLAFLLSQTLRSGWRRTLPATLAPLISDGPIIVLVLLILTQTPPWLLNLIQVGGGLFLLYLAWGAFKATQAEVVVVPQPTPEAGRQNLLKGAMMNTLSPGPWIFWSLLAGPIVMEAWRESPSFGLSFMFGFYGLLIGGFAGFVLLFAASSRIDPRLNRVLNGVAAAALFVFGLYQIWQGFATFTP